MFVITFFDPEFGDFHSKLFLLCWTTTVTKISISHPPNAAITRMNMLSAVKNTRQATITFDCRVTCVFVVEFGVCCRENTVVLCCGIFFVVWLNSAGSHTAINLFLASSSRKKYAQLEYNGGLFVWSSFGCRNHVLDAAMMVRSPLQGCRSNKKAVAGLQRTLRR